MTHPRISVSAVSSYRNTVAEDLALWQQLGLSRVGLTMGKLEISGVDDSVARIRDAGVDVTNLITFGPALDHQETWAERRDCIVRAVDTAVALGADCLVLTTGRAGVLAWEEAAERLREFLSPLPLDRVPVIIEHTNQLRLDVSFVHTLRDDVDLARMLGVGVLCELNTCWAERGVHQTIRTGMDVIRLVQVSDFVIGTKDTPNRVVPGDGDIPLEKLVRSLLDAGYPGVFDIELIGPRIEDEGYATAIARSVAYLSELLASSGA